MRKFVFIIIGTLNILGCFSQTFDWNGNTSDFIIYPDSQIQLSASNAGKSYITTASSRYLNTVWEFHAKLAFNPSSSNYVDVYLCTDNDDLTASSNAYFVRIGYTDDNVCLYQKKDGRSTKIIEGKVKRLDLSSVDIRIKVTSTASGEWNLFSCLNTEIDFYNEGQIVDYNYFEANHFGLMCVYTVTRNKGFYFDNIHISIFDENADNELNNLSSPEYNDIIINEVLFNADSESSEYVEFFNRSEKVIDLSRLTFALRKQDGSLSGKCSFAKYPQAIYPQEFVVITKSIDNVCRSFDCNNNGIFIETSLPALNNSNADLVLINEKNEIVDEFIYSEKMHQQLVYNKKGIALERINPEKPTQDTDNWQSASFDSGYGTPGKQNSQYAMETSDNIWLENEVITPNSFTNNKLIISYQLKESGQTASVSIYNSQGKLVKQLGKNVLLGTSGSFEWTGDDNSGNICHSGIYIAYIEYVDLNGSVKNKKLVFTVSN